MFISGLVLAQAAPASQPAQAPLSTMLFPIALVGFVFYFLVFRPQKKERQKQQQLIDSIKKNDRVMTIGGVLGTVVSVKGDEVTLKVDESTNTKITFIRSAIKTVVSGTSGDEKAEAKSASD